MQFERTKLELKRRFYEQNKIDGKSVNIRKRILNLHKRIYAFSKGKMYFRNTPWTAGSIKEKIRGSLTSLPREGVSSNQRR
jgi:hypothetical protein